MNSLERLVSLHKGISLYNITEDSNIYRELSVYAEEFERLREKLKSILREGFVSTAEDEGLSIYESIWGAKRDELSAEQRRNMILTRLSLCEEDFTAERAEKLLDIVGIKGVIREYPQTFRITVEVEGIESLAKRKWIRNQLRLIFPAHLETDPVFEGFDWQKAEERALTFSQIEERMLCWDDTDILCV